MRTFMLVFAIAVSVSGISCKKEMDKAPEEKKSVYLTENQKKLILSSNSFGFDLFGKVNEISGNDKNLMVSPLSLSMALGMTRNGAANKTLTDMTNTLGFGGQSENEINESYKYIIKTFSSLDPKVRLQIANSIWYRNDFTVEQSFPDVNKLYFDASVTSLDFSAPDAVTIINSWVNEKTNELIPEILDVIPAGAMMYLVNAVYFKGQWKYRFDAKQTEQKPFTLQDGSVIQAPAMRQRAAFNYLRVGGFEAIDLPYSQGNYMMTVLLPEYGKRVSDVIVQLTQENWNLWSKQYVEKDIQVQLPKFKYAYQEKNMESILTALGMGVAFDPYQADFTRINSRGGLYISRVLHKSFIETNEEGTEASGVTAVEISNTAINVDELYYFTINRPFVYFIQEKATGTILFIGTVMNPIE